MPIPPSSLSIPEIFALDVLALELQTPGLAAVRRLELANALDRIAERYAWDFRLAVEATQHDLARAED